MNPSQRRTIPVSGPAHPAHPAHTDGAPAKPAGAPSAGTWAGRQAAAAHQDAQADAAGHEIRPGGHTASPPEQAAGTPERAAGTPERTAGTPERAAGTPERGAGSNEPATPEAVPAHPAPAPAPAGESDGPSGAGHNGAPAAAPGAGTDDLARVTAERDEYLALAQRARADFENYRKRVVRDSRLAEERGVVKVVRELLPALDNLQRALDSAATDDPLLSGVRLVLSDIQSALSRLGVQSFSPQGEEFDPSAHEAVAVQPVPGALAGSVVEVYQSGYRIGETMIRPARVVVAGE